MIREVWDEAWAQYGWRTLLAIPAAVGIVLGTWVAYVVAWAVFS